MNKTINGFLSITYKTDAFKRETVATGHLLENSSENCLDRVIELGKHTFPTLNNGYCADVKLLKKEFLAMAIKKAKELKQNWSISDIYTAA